jgi:hypothetical protein
MMLMSSCHPQYPCSHPSKWLRLWSGNWLLLLFRIFSWEQLFWKFVKQVPLRVNFPIGKLYCKIFRQLDKISKAMLFVHFETFLISFPSLLSFLFSYPTLLEKESCESASQLSTPFSEWGWKLPFSPAVAVSLSSPLLLLCFILTYLKTAAIFVVLYDSHVTHLENQNFLTSFDK